MAPPFVIASSGRCGSTYIAAVLSRLGVPCGHELYWPRGKGGTSLTCDSTRFVVPELETYDGVVFHQVRDPIKTISSLASGKGNPRYVLREVMPTGPLAYATAFWVDYNRKIEKYAERRWRVEDVDADLVAALALRMGTDATVAAAQAALDQIEVGLNKHKVDYATWDDIPDGPDKREAIEMAGRYGYGLEA